MGNFCVARPVDFCGVKCNQKCQSLLNYLSFCVFVEEPMFTQRVHVCVCTLYLAPNNHTVAHSSLSNKWNEVQWCESNFHHPVGVIVGLMSVSILHLSFKSLYIKNNFFVLMLEQNVLMKLIVVSFAKM